MRDFRPKFEAMHAAADGDMKRARELLKKKTVEEGSSSSHRNWFAEMEEKEEAAAARFRKVREAAEGKPEA